MEQIKFKNVVDWLNLVDEIKLIKIKLNNYSWKNHLGQIMLKIR